MRENLSILSVEDDELFQESIKSHLGAQNRLSCAASLAEARKMLARGSFDVVILDKELPDGDGLTLISEVRERQPSAAVIMLTHNDDWYSIQKALDLGASDYLVKERNALPQLHVRIPLALRNAAIASRNEALAERMSRSLRTKMVGSSPAILELRYQIERLRGRAIPVLITGESGTGKELIAQQIHAVEEDPKRPFFDINCAAIPENLVESELFGHVRGSFTGAFKDRRGLFELASGGDLFLDEVGELSLPVQAKLLRVLDTQEVVRVGSQTKYPARVRVIAATNRSLEEMVKKGTFRQDLFYRLNTICIQTAPLRKRREDIPELAEYFVLQTSNGKIRISEEAKAFLVTLPWPGNIRELKNAVESAIDHMIKRRGKILDQTDFEAFAVNSSKSSLPEGALPLSNFLPANTEELNTQGLHEFLESAERLYLRRALDLAQGNISRVSDLMGLPKSTLYRKVKELGIRETRKEVRELAPIPGLKRRTREGNKPRGVYHG